MTLKESD